MPAKNNHHKTRNIDQLRADLLADHAKYGSWPKVSGEWQKGAKGYTTYDFPPGTLDRIASGDYEPVKEAVRNAFGLPALLPAPACPRCGSVHVTKRCTAGRQGAKARRYIMKKWLVKYELGEVLMLFVVKANSADEAKQRVLKYHLEKDKWDLGEKYIVVYEIPSGSKPGAVVEL